MNGDMNGGMNDIKVDGGGLFSDLSAPALSVFSSKKNPLIVNILKLHNLVNDIVSFNSLSYDNQICLKNCICIGIVESLRFLPKLDRKGLVNFYQRTQDVLRRLKDALFSTNDTEFESRFRVKFETHQHLNFRIFNSYDNGLVFNILNFGMFYHNRRFLYNENIKNGKESIKDANNKAEYYNKERDYQKQRYDARQFLFAQYNKTVVDKKHILPHPDKDFNFVGGVNGSKQEEYIENIKLFLQNKGNRNNSNPGKKKNTKKTDEESATEIFKNYITIMKHMKDMAKPFSENPENIIDQFENRSYISQRHKRLLNNIITSYFTDTTGIFKGNILSSDHKILEKVTDFPDIFVNQIESASLELDYINFKVS